MVAATGEFTSPLTGPYSPADDPLAIDGLRQPCWSPRPAPIHFMLKEGHSPRRQSVADLSGQVVEERNEATYPAVDNVASCGRVRNDPHNDQNRHYDADDPR
jgi:hypothetical protein